MKNDIRLITTFIAASLLISLPLCYASDDLPKGTAPPAIVFPYFPSKTHAVIWRNWELVPKERIAAVIKANPDQVTSVAISMGLPLQATISPELSERGYISILRSNWHLLPYEQLIPLLDLTAEELATRLREDDFLYIKLGSLKPTCEPVIYSEPTPDEAQRAAQIKAMVQDEFGAALGKSGEQRFAFLDRFSQAKNTTPSPASTTGSLRFIYSYFAPFGDPLLESRLDPYPDGLLEQLQQQGVNGVWLHTVLRDLAPGGEDFPEFGSNSEIRLRNLRQLTQRCARYGIKVYLYINEPRAMPEAFFKHRPHMKGVKEGDYHAMCTSDHTVLAWLTDALAHVFSKAPELGGVFSITASENLTNCASHHQHKDCLRCSKRTANDIIAEVNTAIRDGVRRSSPNARVICYDWGWNKHGDASDTIAALPSDVDLMSVSEWGKSISRGGVNTNIGEYSLSTVGPGPRASRHWEVAKERGLGTLAKVQFNNSWELSAVPWLPVADLVASHTLNIASAGVDGMMLSWSLGGYPSPNLQVAQIILDNPGSSPSEALDRVAMSRYGTDAAPEIRKAWKIFSEAFSEFPYHTQVLYTGPQQLGPANLLHLEKTGYKATMVGFPYDDLASWLGPYPAPTWIIQFEKIEAGWETGLRNLRNALKKCTPETRKTLEGDIRLAEAAGIHFASCANQARFILARDSNDINVMKEAIAKESRLAKRLYNLAKTDSRIGFEASNHYYYVPLDLIEKVINCRWLEKQIGS